MALNLTDMRQIARTQALANGSDTSLYTDFNMDTAIASAVDEFIDATKYTKRVDTVLLASGTMTLPTMPTGFVAGRLLSAYMTSANVVTWAYGYGSWITYTGEGAPYWDPVSGGYGGFSAELEVVDIAKLISARQGVPTSQQPYWIAFDTYNTGYVYPQTPEPYAATANMSGTFPTMDLASVTVGTPGTGIYSAPTTMVSDGFGGTANIAFTLSAGVITGISVSGSNSQFKVAPNVNVAPVLTAPQVNFTLSIRWFEPFTTFTQGTQGAWSATTKFYPGDIVSTGGNLYQCIAPSLNNSPPNTTYWLAQGAGTATAPSTITAPASLPDSTLREILTIGAPAFFMWNKPEMLEKASLKFESLKSKYQRLGSLGTKGYTRTAARSNYGSGGGYGGY